MPASLIARTKSSIALPSSGRAIVRASASATVNSSPLIAFDAYISRAGRNSATATTARTPKSARLRKRGSAIRTRHYLDAEVSVLVAQIVLHCHEHIEAHRGRTRRYGASRDG